MLLLILNVIYRWLILSLKDLLETYGKLRKLHFNILKLMERSLNRFEYVPIQYMAKKLRVKKAKLESIMSFLAREELVKIKEEPYKGYAITYKGLDILAINDITSMGLITDVGAKIGVGKEGDIWIAYFGDIPRILKFFRLGRESFKKIKVHRPYYLGKAVKNWYQVSKLSAKREFRALKVLYNGGVRVPEPLFVTRHVVVMGYVDGKELVKTIIDKPLYVFENIIIEIAKAYDVGIVHADLSEFNVLVNEKGDIFLIDWPQYVISSHPDAMFYLKRDVENIIRYFIRKYLLDVDELKRVVETHISNKDVIEYLFS